MRPIHFLALCLSVATLATLPACGGSASQTVDEADPAKIAGPPKPWDEMEHAEKADYMRDRVVPVMKPLFVAFNPKAYAEFTCKTCHGPDAREREFKMPNPHNEMLYPTGSPEQLKTVAEHPEEVRFMFQKVVPTMQALLGLEDFDEVRGTGFTCYFCHPAGQVAAPVVAPGG
ncbi:MAG: hypothetical protein R3F39_16315 [Myxococcota bacterium]